ncbi:ATP-binding protein, partial [Leptolyngbya sp. FACHB-711]|uniref:ATP-binding protein n=1 Tax=Leptolyngbya sp. FACHB-711 TaxID=2692813 RepID=UPI00168987F2
MLPNHHFTLEAGLDILNALVYAKQGKHLSQLQVHLLQASWSTERQNYGAIAKAYGYSENYLKYDAGPKLWHLLSDVLQEKVSKTNVWAAIERRWQRERKSNSDRLIFSPAPPSLMQPAVPSIPLNSGHGITLPDTACFYGREAELSHLRKKAIADRHRLIAVAGIGGIGKTALVAQFVQQLYSEYEVYDKSETAEAVQKSASLHCLPFQKIVWHSLDGSILLNQLLNELMDS